MIYDIYIYTLFTTYNYDVKKKQTNTNTMNSGVLYHLQAISPLWPSAFGDSPGFDGNFTPLREDHLSCRETLPQKKQARSYSEPGSRGREDIMCIYSVIYIYITYTHQHMYNIYIIYIYIYIHR